MKTAKIGIHQKDEAFDADFACGLCFALVELVDRYCWDCGAYLSNASTRNFEELKKFNEQENKE